MSEDTPESELDRHKAEAARLLEEIRKLRADSEAELLAAAQKRKEADEHATYAYQAKVNTEKHAKDVSVLKGQADGDASTLAAAKKNFDELIAAATLAKVTLEADTKAASEKRRAFEQSLEATESALVSSREKAQQIEKTKVDVDSLANAIQKLREEATQAQAKTVQASGKTDEERAKAADHAAQSAELLKQLTVTRTKGSEEAAQIHESGSVGCERARASSRCFEGVEPGAAVLRQLGRTPIPMIRVHFLGICGTSCVIGSTRGL